MSFKTNGYTKIEDWRKERERQKRRYRLKNGSHKWRSRWTAEEVERVMEHSIPDVELSKEIKHSVVAIQVCRSRNRKKILTEESENDKM